MAEREFYSCGWKNRQELTQWLQENKKKLLYYTRQGQVKVQPYTGIQKYARSFNTLDPIPAHYVKYSNISNTTFKKHIAMACKILMPIIDKPIWFQLLSSANVEKDHVLGSFQIKLHSSYYGDKFPTIGRTGIPIVVDNDVVGHLGNNSINVYYNIHTNLDLWHEILLSVVNALGEDFDHEAHKKRLGELEKQRLIEAKTKYRNEYYNMLQHNIAKDHARGNIKISSLEDKIKKLSNDLFDCRRELAATKVIDSKEEAIKQLMSDYDSVVDSFDNVTSIKIEGKNLIFETKQITSYDRETDNYYDLGRLHISFSLGSRGDIYASSIDYPDYDLPHVRENDDFGENDNPYICLGSVQDEVMNYVSNYEISSAITFLIHFFEKGVDSEDEWGQHIHDFPITNK